MFCSLRFLGSWWCLICSMRRPFLLLHCLVEVVNFLVYCRIRVVSCFIVLILMEGLVSGGGRIAGIDGVVQFLISVWTCHLRETVLSKELSRRGTTSSRIVLVPLLFLKPFSYSLPCFPSANLDLENAFFQIEKWLWNMRR